MTVLAVTPTLAELLATTAQWTKGEYWVDANGHSRHSCVHLAPTRVSSNRLERGFIDNQRQPPGSAIRKPMRILNSVNTLEDFGREQLSKSFFMREFLHSEIAEIEGIRNIPHNPALALEVGRKLCSLVLEPIEARFGRVSIRSAYRSLAVNAKGAENHNQYRCARNEANFAGHIWDERDARELKGATACIVAVGFLPYFKRTGDWEALAWWIHDNVPAYSEMEFFPRNTPVAFNISWHHVPAKTIHAYAPSRRCLTKPGMPNHEGRHEEAYRSLLSEKAEDAS